VSRLDEWKHCPKCGSPEISVAQGKAECPGCGFDAYASSNPTASAVCLGDDGRIMLARRGIDPAKGKWDFPGGFLEENEHPLDCLRRELEEEAGVEVEPLDFLGVWLDAYGPSTTTLNLYWTARIVEGKPEPADDVAAFEWFDPAEIGDDMLAFPHTREVISALRQQDA
jgi:ADP-ribose pyrophosphatase YjhB (NUDIX family)